MKYGMGLTFSPQVLSLPLRECGLKYTEECRKVYNIIVTPLAGVWIEIFTGAVTATSLTSLPLRECGLKFSVYRQKYSCQLVTPLAGVWIEI